MVFDAESSVDATGFKMTVAYASATEGGRMVDLELKQGLDGTGDLRWEGRIVVRIEKKFSVSGLLLLHVA